MILLRKLELKDAKEYYNIAKDKKVENYVFDAYTKNVEAAAKLIKELNENEKFLSFAVIDEKERIVGAIIAEIGKNAWLPKVTVSYFMGSKYRKHGYCREALKLFINYIKENTHYRAIDFAILEDNEKSIAVMEALSIPLFKNTFYRHYRLSI